jgi:hypothetical protein
VGVALLPPPEKLKIKGSGSGKGKAAKAGPSRAAALPQAAGLAAQGREAGPLARQQQDGHQRCASSGLKLWGLAGSGSCRHALG